MSSLLDRPPVTELVAPVLTTPASSPPPTPAAPPTTGPQPWLPLRVSVPLTIILGYGALLVTGFGTSLGSWRPIPVYLFLGFLLFWLQASIEPKRTLASVSYVVLATGFALLYAADVVFNTSQGWHFTRDIRTYLAINAFMYLMFFVEVIRNRRAIARQSRAAAEQGEPAQRTSLLTLTALATDLTGLALVALLATGLAAIVQQGSQPYVSLNMNAALGVSLPASIQNVQNLDFVIALSAAAITLLVLAMISAISSLSGQSMQAPAEASEVQAVTNVRGALRRIMATALDEIVLAVRWASGPIIWIMGTLSAAWLANQITQYLQSSQHSTRVVDLFNPFSAHSVARYGQGLQSVVLALVAAAAAILAITLVEHDGTIIRRALAALRQGGQAIVLSLAFFTFSLAALNALLVYLDVTRIEPFQISAVTVLALIVSGMLAMDTARRTQRARRMAKAR